MTKRTKAADVVPIRAPDWKSAFQNSAMRTSFCLALTQPMLELLCAVADQVRWDRGLYYLQYGAARPNNWIAAEAALVKRGLIVRMTHRGSDSKVHRDDKDSCDTWVLTPAGDALVSLLKVTGIFVEADAAANKRSRTDREEDP